MRVSGVPAQPRANRLVAPAINRRRTDVQAIILVGGRGTRLQPLTDTRPKPMLPIVDVPFLEHQLDHLRRHGITKITFACGFMPSQITSWFGEGTRNGLEL